MIDGKRLGSVEGQRADGIVAIQGDGMRAGEGWTAAAAKIGCAELNIRNGGWIPIARRAPTAIRINAPIFRRGRIANGQLNIGAIGRENIGLAGLAIGHREVGHTAVQGAGILEQVVSAVLRESGGGAGLIQIERPAVEGQSTAGADIHQIIGSGNWELKVQRRTDAQGQRTHRQRANARTAGRDLAVAGDCAAHRARASQGLKGADCETRCCHVQGGTTGNGNRRRAGNGRAAAKHQRAARYESVTGVIVVRTIQSPSAAVGLRQRNWI